MRRKQKKRDRITVGSMLYKKSWPGMAQDQLR